MARSSKKGFFVDPGLWKQVQQAQSTGDRKPIKTWSRRSTITPDFVGLNINVHNGKSFLPVYVTENMVGRAEILETFTIPKVGTIAGSRIVEGKAIRHAHCRVVRDGIQVYQGTVGALRRF